MPFGTIPFPKTVPDEIGRLDDEPVFDPAIHLQLEVPATKLRLGEIGYTREEIARCPSDVAVAGPFRVLSDEGAAALLDITRRLKTFAQSSSRIQVMVRYAAYRSRFMRDLSLSPAVTAFVSDVLETPIVPHTLAGLALAHVNYAPDDLERPVDRWHRDMVGIVYVMTASDPHGLAGGRFQYFLGTTHEADALQAAGTPIPNDRVVSVEFPGPGHAVIQQGNMLVHRAAPLERRGERTTFLVSYLAADLGLADPTHIRDFTGMDPAHIVYPEWARHKAWMARAKLDRLIDDIPFTDDRTVLVAALKDAVSDIETAIADISDETPGRMMEYDT
jgi:hypothetical protein